MFLWLESCVDGSHTVINHVWTAAGRDVCHAQDSGSTTAWCWSAAPVAEVAVPPDLGVVARQPDRRAGDQGCCWWCGVRIVVCWVHQTCHNPNT